MNIFKEAEEELGDTQGGGERPSKVRDTPSSQARTVEKMMEIMAIQAKLSLQTVQKVRDLQSAVLWQIRLKT
eukprot:499166-Karenia_brevis.AAC.1